jgi:hypothetical protein
VSALMTGGLSPRGTLTINDFGFGTREKMESCASKAYENKRQNGQADRDTRRQGRDSER